MNFYSILRIWEFKQRVAIAWFINFKVYIDLCVFHNMGKDDGLLKIRFDHDWLKRPYLELETIKYSNLTLFSPRNNFCTTRSEVLTPINLTVLPDLKQLNWVSRTNVMHYKVAFFYYSIIIFGSWIYLFLFKWHLAEQVRGMHFMCTILWFTTKLSSVK